MMKLDTGNLSGRAALTSLGICLSLANPHVTGAALRTRSDVSPGTTASAKTRNAKVIETATFALG